MKFSENFYSHIVMFEGFRSCAYRCPSGVWTIGYGTTSGVYKGMTITQEQAFELLEEDCVKLASDINNLNLLLSQCQFDAVGLLCYNIGFAAFKRSTLCSVIRKSPSSKLVGECWLKWCYAKGKKLHGLQIRRATEYKLYCGE